ncbi:MAG: ABC transporter ATP-binding protein [Candidatus Coatesbacteria bacterium]|nr:ABC transporter ATP-binding protein [Candidatus Coatesbacteria bacterium]
MQAAIELRQVSKSYRRFARLRQFKTLKGAAVRDLWRRPAMPESEKFNVALKDISLSIEPGKTAGIIGLNASGKSTLLRVIAGITKPTRGTVEVDGKISTLLEIGAGFHPEISGRENVYINGAILGLSKSEIQSKFDEIVKFAELEDFIDFPVKTYSSGMFMRLGFSVAVNVDPDILLIDEVLAVGDAVFAQKCYDRIFDYKRREKTIVIVSHDLGAVQRLCDEVAWLHRGELMQYGETKKVIGNYLQEVTEGELKRYAQQHEKSVEKMSALEAPKDVSEEELPYMIGPAQNSPDPAERWGTREIEITSVAMRNEKGEERYVFSCGDTVFVEIGFVAHKRIEQPVFGVGIFRTDGVWCYGTNTMIDKKSIESVEGEGHIIIKFDSLPLLSASYYLDVAAHAENDHPYDYLNRLFTFAVRSDRPDMGIFRPDHKWILEL